MSNETNFSMYVDRSELKKQMMPVLSDGSMNIQVWTPGISPLCPM